MSKLKFELHIVHEEDGPVDELTWLELCGFKEDNPDDCPVCIRADSFDEMKELVSSTLEVLKNFSLCPLPVRTVLIGDYGVIKLDE